MAWLCCLARPQREGRPGAAEPRPEPQASSGHGAASRRAGCAGAGRRRRRSGPGACGCRHIRVAQRARLRGREPGGQGRDQATCVTEGSVAGLATEAGQKNVALDEQRTPQRELGQRLGQRRRQGQPRSRRIKGRRRAYARLPDKLLVASVLADALVAVDARPAERMRLAGCAGRDSRRAIRGTAAGSSILWGYPVGRSRCSADADESCASRQGRPTGRGRAETRPTRPGKGDRPVSPGEAVGRAGPGGRSAGRGCGLPCVTSRVASRAACGGERAARTCARERGRDRCRLVRHAPRRATAHHGMVRQALRW